MTIQYVNTSLTLAIGTSEIYTDLEMDQVSGEVYRVREADLFFTDQGETAISWLAAWLSVAATPRTVYDLPVDGFAADIIGAKSWSKASLGHYLAQFETEEDGYLADDPYFVYKVRFGLHSNANAAGAAPLLKARFALERIKETNAIRQLMYNRAQS